MLCAPLRNSCRWLYESEAAHDGQSFDDLERDAAVKLQSAARGRTARQNVASLKSNKLATGAAEMKEQDAIQEVSAGGLRENNCRGRTLQPSPTTSCTPPNTPSEALNTLNRNSIPYNLLSTGTPSKVI